MSVEPGTILVADKLSVALIYTEAEELNLFVSVEGMMPSLLEGRTAVKYVMQVESHRICLLLL